MPMTIEEFEKLRASKPPGTSLADILGVADIYVSGNLSNSIYLFPEVIGNPAAVVPSTLKERVEKSG